jgi:plastocyanin
MGRKLALLAVTAILAVSATAGSALARSDGGNVNVAVKEFKFVGVPKNLPAGSTTFSFKNVGKFPHNFTISWTSKGGTKFKTKDLKAGSGQDLTVNLKPGSYIAVCTIFNGYHISQGMVKSFSVGQINFDTGQWE